MAGARVNVLAIETATDLVGAALLRSDGGCVERSHLGGRAHGELLAPAIEEVCATSGCGLDVVDALAVDVGPGLFTGLRVGVATAKALGQALGVGVVGVTSLDTMCAGVLEEGPGDLGRWVVPVVDARRGEVFASAYAVGGPGADTDDPATGRVDRTEALSPEELAG
ncbi:MAG TPA: tRNA (adenosine(37)-N6)-threonylcarbamoyltransferase complex dimerization subunit type 1 TsaB, partial [Acidimicrobiales bacterium]|nr:tRNA (adenosine(37)-N6)-threonylcarbamoyltransferase complex dimerization subunit type 1 TsaB [Acidimicrobiales bacterium]